MDYQETLAFLYQQLPMYQRVGRSAYKKDLDNTYRLLDFLGNPQHEFNSIHIAGTNGKGSSAYMLESILRHAGYRTGLYTSPHLKSFTERIQLGGVPISEQEVVDFVALVRPAIEEVQPSFFELTVAMAFWYFARQKVDIAVIETGLGGRLDSTNVITPLVSLITMIGWDHADLLGDTLEKIAGEKAGIIKPGVPVVIGAHQPDLLSVFEEKARGEGSPLFPVRRAYSWETKHQNITSLNIDLYKDGELIFTHLLVGSGAAYILENVPGVLGVLDRLRDQTFEIDDEHIRHGLRAFEIKGRWQLISSSPTVLADISHNAAGLSLLMDQLAKQPGKKHIVFGVVKEKNVSELLALLPKETDLYWTQSQVPRSLPVQELAAQARSLDLTGTSFDHVNEALTAAKQQAHPEDIIVVCGSTFVVAEIDDL